MLCLFLFHINYTIYANHVLIKSTTSRIYSDLETFGSDSIFVKSFHARLK